PNADMDGKIQAFKSGADANPTSATPQPNAWRSFVKNSSRVMNGASAVYSMARVFIGPTAMPPQSSGQSFHAPINPMELPEKLPRPYRQGKPKGQKYADEVDPTQSQSTAQPLSGDPPPPKADDEIQFVVDKEKFAAWREGQRAMDRNVKGPTPNNGLSL
ncbi:MAG: hypothetical protein AAF213_06350, partial [Pseudomonadota bacterium]